MQVLSDNHGAPVEPQECKLGLRRVKGTTNTLVLWSKIVDLYYGHYFKTIHAFAKLKTNLSIKHLTSNYKSCGILITMKV